MDRTYSNLITLLTRHEGVRLRPYRDSVGKLTIGIGRNLDDVGIDEQEAFLMRQNDIQRAFNLVNPLPWFRPLNLARQDVIIMMAFNMGLGRLLEFKDMIAALNAADYVRASAEMLDSKWATQVGQRAKDLAGIMRNGFYPPGMTP